MNKSSILPILGVALAFALLAAIGYGSWRFERWVNWHFSYGPKIEKRIEALEKRVQELERKETK